jgi:hypothetical protein
MKNLKKLVLALGSLALASTLAYAEKTLPMDDINTIKSCTPEALEGFKTTLPTGSIDNVYTWLVNVNDAMSTNNKSKLQYLTKARTKYKLRSNLVDLKSNYQDSRCRKAVDNLNTTFLKWHFEAKKQLNKGDRT